jgi:Fe-S-cluster containining protein
VARRLFLWWQRRVNGFELRESRPRERVFVFECTHFDPVSRSCDSYETRPGMCRDYPRGLLDQAAPELFPDCGYRAVPANAERLAALIDARLPPQRARELKRGLRIRS